jgi:hypothetical protein
VDFEQGLMEFVKMMMIFVFEGEGSRENIVVSVLTEK